MFILKSISSRPIALLLLIALVQAFSFVLLFWSSENAGVHGPVHPVVSDSQTLWSEVRLPANTSSFRRGSVETASSLSVITLFVAVLTHPDRRDRRDGIRDTWMKRCEDLRAVLRCRFFTDGAGLENETELALRGENRTNDDMEFIPIAGNYLFAERLLWILNWVSKRFSFNFFLRIDDDHFLCVDHLMYDLSFRPKTALYWGFFHCKRKIVRVDEAWLVLSADLVHEVLAKSNSTLLCHPYGDQAVAMWINNSTKNVTYFMDNGRIVHKSAGRDQRFFVAGVCERYISLHGSYPTAMKRFWLVSHKIRKRLARAVSYHTPAITPFRQRCKHSPIFDYTGFNLKFRFEPRPCRLKPRWRLISKRHGGREEEGEMYSSY